MTICWQVIQVSHIGIVCLTIYVSNGRPMLISILCRITVMIHRRSMALAFGLIWNQDSVSITNIVLESVATLKPEALNACNGVSIIATQ